MNNLLLLLYYLTYQQNMDISKPHPQPALLSGQFTFNFQTVQLYMYFDSIRFKSFRIQCTLPFCFDLSYDVQVRQKQWVLTFYMDPPIEHYKSIKSSRQIKFQFMSNQDINIWDTKLIQFIKRKGFDRRFKQQDMLGQGSYGRVYQIWNFFTSIISATKAIKKEQIYQSLKRKRGIENEIQILRKIKKINENRQNLLQIQGVYEGEDKIYIAMELISGKNLREVMVKQGNFLTITNRKMIMKGILNGLAALCKNNIIHRDIKPENIMISDNEKIKIVDFGFATELNSQLIFKLCGTEGYLAPELDVKNLNQLKTTSKMDVFAAGTILYEMIFKKPLVEGKGQIYKHNQMKLDLEIQKLNVQKSQAELLSKMLVNDPQKRISAEQALKHDYFWKKGLRVNKEQNDRRMTIEKDKQAMMGAPMKKVKREKQN